MFAITERISKAQKKILMFYDKIRGEEYMNGNIIKRSYKINNGKSQFQKNANVVVFSS
jgi:hypothetical protein